ncbi:NAD-dependent epimerase/dehydratase family protein, partial [Mycobacterium tuberculosis]
MRVLVTGGTGFVGGWTAKAIADAGHSVRFLVRNPARLKTSVAKLGVDVSDFAVADISDRDSVREALNGCDAVVHSAALVATDPREIRMLSTNMAGAQNVLGQAVELEWIRSGLVELHGACFVPTCEAAHEKRESKPRCQMRSHSMMKRLNNQMITETKAQ